MMTQALHILNSVFGYAEFRPFQEAIIASVLEKKDTLVIMPTGGGKSLCYQIPALIFKGLTVVVSPLISLMKDQVDQMKAAGVDAIVLNSMLDLEEYHENIMMIKKRQATLLYVAPETLCKNEILALLAGVDVDCITIDEAHCISEWGHDFRPEYRQLAAVRKKFPGAVCVALTATATERVRGDIKRNLDFSGSNDFVASFDRENLFLQVAAKQNPLGQTLAFLQDFKNQSGIIYCFSRNQVDQLALRLEESGYSVKPYHAGLSDEQRRVHQELFIRDEVQIVVATIAFGMGIHKTNVRFVIHFDLPKSIESYYQEIGRAGRDGLPSQCLMLYSYADVRKIMYFIDQKSDENERRIATHHVNALINYADSTLCRRIPLITYFGEAYSKDSCCMCDNCMNPVRDKADITTQARMFLSCVKRTGERFGITHVIDVLRGSESQKVFSFDHHNLSTYGIGKEYSKKQWQGMAWQFIQQGLILQDIDDHGRIRLTNKGYVVMKGLDAVLGHITDEKAEPAAPKRIDVEHDGELFDILRKKRKELADAENVPPYIIFSDKSLVEMSIFYPQDPRSMKEIYGVGTRKLEKYGEIFINLIREYCSERGIQGKNKSGNAGVRPLHVPRHVLVGEEYKISKSIEEIAQKFDIKPERVLHHLYNYILEGHEIQDHGIARLCRHSDDIKIKIFDAFGRHGTERLKPVFESLNGTISYEDLGVYRLCYLTKE